MVERGSRSIDLRSGITGAIGNTPLVRLQHASQVTGCDIFGKAEFMNPGMSVKDRPARHMIIEAEQRGDLKPGGLIVEGTAGNTGIGLTLVAKARGYRTRIVMPDTQSREKVDFLKACGAEVMEVPAKPYSNPQQYQHVARRLAEELESQEEHGVLFADQWNNLDNRAAHFATTGPEIWQQTSGRVDGFICAVGTGGTLAGVSTFLQSKNPNISIGCADPCGAAMASFFSHGKAEPSSGGSIAEGVGLGRSTVIVEGLSVDVAWTIPDEEFMPVLFDLVSHEGLLLGASAGLNVAGAIRLARRLGPGHTIVTILCDSGARYQSKLYNIEFLKQKKLPIPGWLS
ncbi:MAG: cysteine synthase A [Lysobacterales bacterium]